MKLVTINKNTMSIIIQLSEPVSKDAVIAAPAKDFSQAYILSFSVNTHSLSADDYVSIRYCPFDQASAERLTEQEQTLTVPFWQTIESVPEAALVFKAVAEALPILITKQKEEGEKLLLAGLLIEEQLPAFLRGELRGESFLADPPTKDTPTEDTPTEDTPTEDPPTEDPPTEDTAP